MRTITPIVPFGASPTNVSTLTAMVPFTNWTAADALLFAIINLDSTNPVTMRVESSEDGIHPDVDFTEVVAPPGQQASIEVGPAPVRSYWRVSAYTQSPAYPTVPVKVRVASSSSFSPQKAY
jgi:hypothetical protein